MNAQAIQPKPAQPQPIKYSIITSVRQIRATIKSPKLQTVCVTYKANQFTKEDLEARIQELDKKTQKAWGQAS